MTPNLPEPVQPRLRKRADIDDIDTIDETSFISNCVHDTAPFKPVFENGSNSPEAPRIRVDSTSTIDTPKKPKVVTSEVVSESRI